ncbi:MAG: ABC transporter permease [Lachnospiraceae bacterium]|nr:ABC transporter permease [Lachnospiraceae bacterium]
MEMPLLRAVGTQKIVVLLVLVVLFALFSILSPTFRSYSTILSILSYSYYITFMAIGATFALITGGVDLSLGAGMICYGLIGGHLVIEKGLPVGVGMLVTLLCGIVFGTFNGVLIAFLEIPPFIATLGTMMITRGIGSIVVGGLSVTWPQAGSEQGWFRSIFRMQIGDTLVPVGFLWVILIVLLMTFILNKTKVGRYVIAIGSNKEATRLSGIKVRRYHVAAYAISGFFTGLAAIAYAATFQGLMPGTGTGLELDAIGSAIIGGTSMTGGAGSIVGTLIGVFIMSMMKTGLPFIGLQANWQQVITGIILILAVGMDVIKNRRLARR